MVKKLLVNGVSCCAVLMLAACASDTDRQSDKVLTEFHSTCLSHGHSAYSQAHTDCVLKLHEERKAQMERRRAATVKEPEQAKPTQNSNPN